MSELLKTAPLATADTGPSLLDAMPVPLQVVFLLLTIGGPVAVALVAIHHQIR